MCLGDGLMRCVKFARVSGDSCVFFSSCCPFRLFRCGSMLRCCLGSVLRVGFRTSFGFGVRLHSKVDETLEILYKDM